MVVVVVVEAAAAEEKEQIVPLWSLMTIFIVPFYLLVVKICLAWYWLPGLLGHSPSCFLDPLASRTYSPRFCICCIPVPASEIQNVHYLLFCRCTVGSPAAV
jgi:hypothetical protein